MATKAELLLSSIDDLWRAEQHIRGLTKMNRAGIVKTRGRIADSIAKMERPDHDRNDRVAWNVAAGNPRARPKR